MLLKAAEAHSKGLLFKTAGDEPAAVEVETDSFDSDDDVPLGQLAAGAEQQ